MRKRFSEEKIIGILREIEKAGQKEEVLRKYGLADQTYYRWKQKYHGTNVPKINKLRELEKENNKLKKLVADYAMANQALRELVEKKRWE